MKKTDIDPQKLLTEEYKPTQDPKLNLKVQGKNDPKLTEKKRK